MTRYRCRGCGAPDGRSMPSLSASSLSTAPRPAAKLPQGGVVLVRAVGEITAGEGLDAAVAICL